MDSISLRRVVDIHFHRDMAQLCLGRGTVPAPSSPIVCIAVADWETDMLSVYACMFRL